MGRNHIDRLQIDPLFEGSEQPPGLAQLEQDEIDPLLEGFRPEGLKKGVQNSPF